MGKAAVVQVGIKALRTPSGEFAPATPIYVPATPKLAEREEAVIASVETVDAKYIKDYIEKRERAAKQTDQDEEAEPELPWWQK